MAPSRCRVPEPLRAPARPSRSPPTLSSSSLQLAPYPTPPYAHTHPSISLPLATFLTARSMAAVHPPPRSGIPPQVAQLAAQYMAHRPLIQKILTLSFVLYAFGTTAKGLISPGRKLKSGDVVEKRGKGRKGRKGGKAPRVEVSMSELSLSWG